MSPRDVHQSDRLSTLPVDVLVDSLLPTFPTCDVIALARTCREWHTFLTCAGQDSEIYWMRKCIHDFNFPVHASGRRTGWFPLYATLARSAAYVWGQNDNARLGLPESTYQLEPELRARLLEGGLVLPTRIELPQAPVSIVAGGWSFHALTADGKVMSWGTLNGGTWSRDDAPLHHEGRALKPTVLPQCDAIGPIKQLEAGRGHVVMLSRDGNVFEFRSFGRIVKIVDESRRWQAGTDVSTVYAGWDYSALLTRAGDVFVWWEPGVARVERGARSAGEDSLPSPSTQGVTFALELDTLRLPSLPDHPRGANEGDKIKLLACGDNFVIALSERSRLYYLSLSPVPDPAQPFARQGAVNDSEDSPVRSRESMARLEAEFLSGRRTWRLMQKFCDRSELEKLDQVRTRPLPETFEITHISAHFNTFAAYSVSATSDSTRSLVLLGDSDWHEQAAPNLIPELQGRGVIKVAHGDYHHLALTSSGELFAWGSFSGGALGLGHPQLADTPLSLTPSHPGRSQGEGSEPRHVHNPNQPLTTPTNRAPPPPHQAFPGFAATPRPALNNRPRAPSRVERPIKVKFDGGRANAAGSPSPSRARDSFVYAVTASGWHSGALAVDLDRSPPLQTSAVGRGTTASSQQGGGKGSDETGGGPIIRLEPHSTGSADRAAQHTGDHRSETSTGTAAGGTSIGSRIGRTFRIGLAGASGTRGANLGGAGGAVRPPSR